MLDRLRFYRSVLLQDMGQQAIGDWRSFCSLRDNVEPYTGKLKDKTILDIGCGRRYPHTLLLHNFGNTVTGIDTDYIAYHGVFLTRYWSELTHNGIESFGRALLLDLLRQKASYYRNLNKLCRLSLDHRDITIKRMNAENMAFPDEAFDLVISALCFEHISNVSRAVSEIYRVLKTGGVAYVTIDLFSSRSGGHHIGTLLSKVPYWDHLRQNKYPVSVYLNKLRENDYVTIFSKNLEILQILREPDEEGKKLLTPEIHSELADYSEKELLTSVLTIIARRPDNEVGCQK